MPLALLDDRSVIRIAGADTFQLLHDVLTVNMDAVAKNGIGYGALLSPQGKILFDFLIHRENSHREGSLRDDLPDGGGAGGGEQPAGWFIDVRKEAAADLVKRLGFYKLRADMVISPPDDQLAVYAVWGETPDDAGAGLSLHSDPRLGELGKRGVAGKDAAKPSASTGDWHGHRIALGVPEGGVDFTFGQAFPHDAAMDDLNGIDFAKGCYVGQEVVSRMQHRGTARKRVVSISAKAPLPDPGGEISVAGRPVGVLGSSAPADGRYCGIGIARLDRLEADSSGEFRAETGDTGITITMPAFARYRPPAP